MKELITIIVPVYNVERQITRCIKSLLEQTYENIEILLVDDGSTDQSLEICKKYEKVDNRINVITKKNGGVSSARNCGIKNAKGKYVCFFDSDDWVDKDICKKLMTRAKETNAQMVICGFSEINEDGQKKDHFPCKKEDELCEDYLKICKDIVITRIVNSPCNKLFLREKISKLFNLNRNMGEDMEFNLEYIKNISKIAYLRECLYFYDVTVEGSLTKNIDLQINAAVENNEIRQEFFRSLNIPEEQIYDEYYNSFISILFSVYLNQRSEFNRVFNRLLKEGKYEMVAEKIKPSGYKEKIIRMAIKYKSSYCLKKLCQLKARRRNK